MKLRVCYRCSKELKILLDLKRIISHSYKTNKKLVEQANNYYSIKYLLSYRYLL